MTTTIRKQNNRSHHRRTARSREAGYSGRNRNHKPVSNEEIQPGSIAYDLDGAVEVEPQTSSSRVAFASGVRAALPVSLGLLSLSVSLGDAAIDNGFSALAALAMSVLLLSGVAQLAMIDLIPSGASAAIAIFTILVISLRLAVYSASLAPHFRTLSAGWKGLITYLLTDPVYAVSIIRFGETGERHKRWYFLGAALAIWITWQAGAVAGVFLGAWVPAGWSLDFLLPLTLIALVVPSLKDGATVAAAISAGVAAVFVAALPLNLGLIAAASAGVMFGFVAESMTERRKP